MSSKGVEAILRGFLNTPVNKSFPVGEFSEDFIQEMQKINPAYTQGNIRTTSHPFEKRKKQDNWTLEETAKALDELINAEKKLITVPNRASGDRKATEALWLPGKPMSLYAPTVPLKSGGVEIRTVYEDEFEKFRRDLEKSNWPLGERNLPMSSLHRNVSYGGTSSQRPRLSAVKDQLSDDSLYQQLKDVKLNKALPLSVGTSAILGTLFGKPSEAEGAYESKLELPELTKLFESEAGLETPFFDPVDLLLAPIGVIGKLPKALAIASEAPINWAMDNAGKGFSGLANMLLGRE